MFAVAVANMKGGTGKTTVATHIAAWFAREGHETALADLDKQRCAAQWLESRPESLQPIRTVELPDDPSELRKGIERLVIDVPAGLKRERIEEIVKFAHIIVVPIMPSAFDEIGTRSFLQRLSELKPVKRGRRGVATIGNRVRPRTRAAARLDQFLAGLAFPPVTRLRDSAIYAEASASGLTIFDIPRSKAGAALDDWEPLLALLRHAAG